MQETHSTPEDAADPSFSEALSASRQEELRSQAQHNRAAARAVLKDAANVAQHSRTLLARLQRRWGRETGRSKPSGPERAGDRRRPNDPASESEPQTLGAAAGKEVAAAETVSCPGGKTAVVVRVAQSLDKITSPQFLSLLLSLDAEMAAVSSQGQPPKPQQPVVADLRGLTRMDGSGVSALIQGRRLFAQRGRRFLVLLKRGSQPEAVFQAHGLSNIIPRIESLAEL